MADFQIFKISFLGEVLEEHYEVKKKARKNFSEKAGSRRVPKAERIRPRMVSLLFVIQSLQTHDKAKRRFTTYICPFQNIYEIRRRFALNKFSWYVL